MDFTPQQPEQQPIHQMHIPKYVFTGVIVGILALFIGTIFFLYNMQEETDAARRATAATNVYHKIIPSPTLEPIITLSAEEQMVDEIIIADPTAELSALEQEAASL